MSASLSGQRAAGSSAGAASPDACTPTPLDAETRFGDQTPAELRSSSDACRPSSGCTGHAAVAGSLQSPSDGTRAEPSDPNAPARHHRQTAGCPARDPAGGKHVGRRSAAEQRRDPKAGGAPGEARCLVLELFYVDLRRPNSVSGAAAPVAELLQEFNSRTCARAAGPHDPRCANTVAEASAPAGAGVPPETQTAHKFKATPIRAAEEGSAHPDAGAPSEVQGANISRALLLQSTEEGSANTDAGVFSDKFKAAPIRAAKGSVNPNAGAPSEIQNASKNRATRIRSAEERSANADAGVFSELQSANKFRATPIRAAEVLSEIQGANKLRAPRSGEKESANTGAVLSELQRAHKLRATPIRSAEERSASTDADVPSEIQGANKFRAHPLRSTEEGSANTDAVVVSEVQSVSKLKVVPIRSAAKAAGVPSETIPDTSKFKATPIRSAKEASPNKDAGVPSETSKFKATPIRSTEEARANPDAGVPSDVQTKTANKFRATPVRSAEEASANTAVRGPRSATDAAPAQTAGAQTAKKAQAAAPLPAGAAATTARPQHIQHSRGSSPPVQAARAPACPTYCPAWFSVESQAPSNEPLPRADLPAGEAAAAPVQPQHGSSPPVQVARAPACSTYRPPGVESQAPSSKPLRAEHVTRALPPRSCAGYPCPGCAEIVEVSHAFCSGCGGRLQAPCLPAEAAPELLCTAFYFKPAEHPRCPTGGDSSAACRLTGSFGGANVAIAHARFSWEHELRCPDGSTAGVDDPPPRLSHVFGFFNAFGVLRVPLDCGGDEVRTAFRREMLLSHPDKNSSRGAGAAATDTILRAREHLLDGGKRAQLEAEVQKAVRRHGKTAVYRHIPQRGLVQEKKHGAAMREGSVPHDSFFV